MYFVPSCIKMFVRLHFEMPSSKQLCAQMLNIFYITATYFVCRSWWPDLYGLEFARQAAHYAGHRMRSVHSGPYNRMRSVHSGSHNRTNVVSSQGSHNRTNVVSSQGSHNRSNVVSSHGSHNQIAPA